MTPEAQRIAISETCGWAVNPLWPVTPTHAVYRRGDELRTTKELPDYLNDLNAMHEAEMSCLRSIHKMEEYRAELKSVINRNHAIELDFCACSTHRAEAFLRTIGKWESP